jgi:hypothetical protein
MIVNHEGNTPTTQCPECGEVELVTLTIRGAGLHCVCGAYVDNIGGLCGTGVEECHLVRIA